MKVISYYGYTITAGAVTGDKGSWRPQVRVSKDQKEIIFDDPQDFPSQSEAEDYAVEMGKHWVHNQLQTQS